MFIRYKFFQTSFFLFLFVIFFVLSFLIIDYFKFKTNEKPSIFKQTTYLSYLTNFKSTDAPKFDLTQSKQKHVTKSLLELGPVPELSGHVLFFNRVPETGSEILVLLLQRLQGRNNFRHFRLKGGEKRLLTSMEQEALVDEVYTEIKQKAIPLTFDRHVYFVNFTNYNRQSPTFINIIRDPVEKLISRFYNKQYASALRNPDSYSLTRKKYKKRNTKFRSIEECVVAGDSECHFITGKAYDLTIPYFCGQNPQCMILNNKWALNTAKENVERYFRIVGILEELNTTLSIYEHELPYFFNGVQKLYGSDIIKSKLNEKTENKKYIDEDVRKYLKETMKTEYEFYEWIRARLFEQLQVIYGHDGHSH